MVIQSRLPAVYLPRVGEGSKQHAPNRRNSSKKDLIGAGPYFNPDDGICVVGLSATGQLRVDWSIRNARDCAAYTGGLTGMSGVDVTSTYPTTAVGCTNGSSGCSNANNVAGALFWSTLGQKCYDTSACTFAGAKLPPVSVLTNFNGGLHFPNGALSAINIGWFPPWTLWHIRQLLPFVLLLTCAK